MDKQKINQAENLLKNYRYLKRNKEILERRIKRCSHKLLAEDGLKGVDYNTIPTSKTNRVSCIVEQMAIKSIEDLETKKQELKDITDVLKDIEIAIEGLKVQEKRLVKLFYLNDEQINWSSVADILFVSKDHARGKLKNNAIKNFYKGYYGIEITS